MGQPQVWSVAQLPDGAGRDASVEVNGFELSCAIPLDPEPEPVGPTPFGLLAASLSACTVMSVRTFLHRWDIQPGLVSVRVAMRHGATPMLEREVTVAAAVEPALRGQLAVELDATPVTRLLRASVPIRTIITTA